MKLRKASIFSFQKKIFDWWDDNKRDLPWRHTRDPYKIIISEVMLQQTQVSRVLPKYDEFLYFFPEVYDLAKSSTSKVLKAWKGMGYNRRALYLKKIAETIVNDYKGEFPEDEKLLIKLPGVGMYTARAILVFAFGNDLAMVDTNIRQIITHFFFGGNIQKPSIIQGVADQLLPKGQSWKWHQALMDYGAIEMQKVKGRRKKPARNATQSVAGGAKGGKVSFRDSNRFYRGRIIDLLREKSIEYNEMLGYIYQTYKKNHTFTDNILRGLAKDGLIEIKGDSIFLPT